jgi:hypothetical protein
MNAKNIFFTLILALGLTNISFAQYTNIADAVTDINTTLASASNTSVFEVSDKGLATKIDTDHSGVVYEFNLNNVEMIKHEQQLNNHLIKFICASGKKCFYCEQNEGEGIIHYLAVDSAESAKKIISAFKYVKQQTSMF